MTVHLGDSKDVSPVAWHGRGIPIIARTNHVLQCVADCSQDLIGRVVAKIRSDFGSTGVCTKNDRGLVDPDLKNRKKDEI